MKALVAFAVPILITLMAIEAHSAPIRTRNGHVQLDLEYPATPESGGKVIHKTTEYSYKIFEGIVPQDIVFIHGNLATNSWWVPAALELRRRVLDDRKLGESSTENYNGRLIMVEWPGYGKAPAPNSLEELRPEVVGGALVQVLKSLNVEKAHIVGHSTGGLYALHTVQTAPEMFDKILLLDSVGPNGLFWAWETLGNYRFGRLEKAIREGDRALVENVVAHTIRGVDRSSPFFQKLVDEAMKAAPINIQGVPQILFNESREQMMSMGRKLAPINQRALIVFGANDEVLPHLTHTPGLQAILPNSEVKLVPDAGHSLQVEKPEVFTDLLVNEFGLLPHVSNGRMCQALWM